MSIEENVQTVKDFFAAIGRGDKQGLLAFSGNPARTSLLTPDGITHE